jgi:hypothetical protein
MIAQHFQSNDIELPAPEYVIINKTLTVRTIIYVVGVVVGVRKQAAL